VQTSTKAKFQLKVMRDSYPDFQINPDPGVCRICPKMLWMHYLVCVCHFAKYGTNWMFAASCMEMVTTGWPLSRQYEISRHFPDGSLHSSAAFNMLSVTHIMPVLVLLSVVGVRMQQCMIWNHYI